MSHLDEGSYEMQRRLNKLFKCVALGSLDDIAALLQGININMCDSDGNTALHIAAAYGFEDKITLLLDNGAAIDESNNNWRTSLHIAAKNGHIEAVRLLISRGADLDAADTQDGTPLRDAIYGKNKSIALLLAGAGSNADVLLQKDRDILRQWQAQDEADRLKRIVTASDYDTARGI